MDDMTAPLGGKTGEAAIRALRPGATAEDLRKSWAKLRRVETVARHNEKVPGRKGQSALDMLRTRVATTMLANSWRTIAVTAPRSGCGTTTLALGLAGGLARQRDTRAILWDLNFRNPGIAGALGLKGEYAAASLLEGPSDITDDILRRGDHLAIVPNTRVVADPAELLRSDGTALVIQQVQRHLAPDFMIFDLPPMLEHDDLLGFLPQVDCVLLVVGAERTTVAQADICERELSGRGKLLGVVMNRCRLGLDELDV
jgi:protein-tyrosine kinase